MAGHGGDVIAELTTDHREVEELFGKLEATSDATQRRELAAQVIAELVRHSVAEEMYLYPTAKEVIPGGEGLVERELKEHAAAEQVMNELDKADPSGPEFATLAGRLIADVRAHIAEEEGELFPRLRDVCPTSQLDDLGNKVRAAKQLAPTRPHPMAPDTPPWNKILGPGTGLVDRLRDHLTGRSTS